MSKVKTRSWSLPLAQQLREKANKMDDQSVKTPGDIAAGTLAGWARGLREAASCLEEALADGGLAISFNEPVSDEVPRLGYGMMTLHVAEFGLWVTLEHIVAGDPLVLVDVSGEEVARVKVWHPCEPDADPSINARLEPGKYVEEA